MSGGETGKSQHVRESYAGLLKRPITASLIGLCLYSTLVPFSRADTSLTTTGTAQYQFNSNVFDLQSNVYTPGVHRADSDLALGGGIQFADKLDLQKLFLNASGTEFRYDRNTDLNHSEYNVDGGVNWQLGSEVDGRADVSRSHTMVPFFNLVPGASTQTSLSVDTDQREAAQFGWRFMPDFRFDAKAYTHVTDEPVVGNPNLQLTETSVQGSFQYIARGNLNSGLTVSYLSGAFGHSVIDTPSYRQLDYGWVTSLRTGHSGFYGEIGYTQRDSVGGANNTAAITGSLEFKDQFTEKSSADLIITRAVNSYIANSGSEIDTSATLDAHWLATRKIEVLLQYSFTDSDLLNQGLVAGTNRIDHLEHAAFTIEYKIQRWLTIKPYASIQTRRSQIPSGNFNASIYGITLDFHLTK